MAIRQIKHRTLADNFANDVRASRRKWGRYIYMLLVLGVAVYLGQLFAGPYIWLDAGGLVAADRVVVSPANEAQVVGVLVNAGERVKKGQLLGYVHSAITTQNLADLRTRYADAAAKVAALNIQLNVANSVERLAQDRQKIARENYTKLVANRGFATDLTVQASMQQLYDAELQVATYRAQRDAASKQLAILNATLSDAQEAIDSIQQRYSEGKIYADDDGIIGAQLAQKGDVLKPGDLFVEMYVGQPYVLGYLETNTLYKINPGDQVNINSGFRATLGVVTEVRPIAVQLPPEFQRTFRPRGRGQVVKIEMTEADFPLSTKVQISSDNYLPPEWRQRLAEYWPGWQPVQHRVTAWLQQAETQLTTWVGWARARLNG